MWNWLKKKLGILDVEKGVVCLHSDMNKAFNRIEAITLAVGKKRVANFRERIVTRGPQRYDEIERDRKKRKKQLNEDYGDMVQKKGKYSLQGDQKQ